MGISSLSTGKVMVKFTVSCICILTIGGSMGLLAFPSDAGLPETQYGTPPTVGQLYLIRNTMSATLEFDLEDTEETRSHLALLLETSENELDRVAKGGRLHLVFSGVQDQEALFIVTKAVSSHGFVLDQPKEPEPEKKQEPEPVKEAPKKGPQTQKGKDEHGSK